MNKTANMRFQPGPGKPPPVLAGRENEKEEIRRALKSLKNGESPSQNIALIGPRGNGKTVLLKWAKEEISPCEGVVECVELNPNHFRAHDVLIESLRNRGALSDVTKVDIKTPFVGLEVSRQGAEKKILKQVLKQRSKNGLAVLIDEAHTLNKYPDVAREFFVDAQALAGDGRPLLLILAGTPNISARFAEIEISFWNRIQKIGVGLLKEAEAQEALQTPLNEMGYKIEGKTLEAAANEAQRYPYFLQLVGDALHQAAKAKPRMLGSGKEIGGAILKQAQEKFDAERDNYYNDRYQELRREGILPEAEAVARRFDGPPEERWISGAAFEVAIEQSIREGTEELAEREVTKRAISVETKLRDVGFVWSQIGRERSCEPGIPSLMKYILKWSEDRDHEYTRMGR